MRSASPPRRFGPRGLPQPGALATGTRGSVVAPTDPRARRATDFRGPRMIRRVDPPPTSPLVRELAEKQGIGWFDAVCAVLKRENRPTVHTTWEVFGKPDLPTPRHRRFYQRLIPFDRRFDEVGLLPDIDETAPNAPLDSLFFVGEFSLKVGDIARRFPRFKKQFNGYDGGTQIFFHPIPREYEFTAVDVWTEREDVWWARSVVVTSVTFGFGDLRYELRDGFHMKRHP